MRMSIAGGAVIKSRVDVYSEQFRANNDSMVQLVAQLNERLDSVRMGGGPEDIARHRSRNKLLARERIECLVDPGSAFLELSALAAWDMYNEDAPAAGLVTGIGVVSGQECVVIAN